jgi:hypothetical protein
MKNGRAMKGHRRAIIAIDPSPIAKRPPRGGWDVSCICGWQGGNWKNSSLVRVAYRKHIDYQIDQCLIRCKRCGIEKPISQMRPDYRYVCLSCFSKLGDEWQQKHPIATARHKRNHHLLKKFGITLEEAEQILFKQGNLCAICKDPIEDKRGFYPHVDHDHLTGRIRGILCFRCNAGLGAFKDDPRRLLAAIQYLSQEKIQ